MHHNHSNNKSSNPVFWVFILSLAAIVIFLGITYILLGNYKSTIYPEDPARDEVRIKNLADLRTENESKLNSYAWVDRSKGRVQIPISVAMKLVVDDLSSIKPQPAYPIVDPASQTAPSADNSNKKSVTSIDVSVSLPSDQSLQDDTNILSGVVNGSSGSIKSSKQRKQQ